MELIKAEEWLFLIVENSVLAIYLVAAVVIIYGTFEAAVGALKAAIRGEENLRQVGVNFGRWLITGLSFMLAADILGTMIETDWEGIGRLAAVAAIRGFSPRRVCSPLATSRPASSAATTNSTQSSGRRPPSGATPITMVLAPASAASPIDMSGRPQSAAAPGKRNWARQRSGRQWAMPPAVLALKRLSAAPKNSR